MLTYQLQTRIYTIKGDGKLKFPNDVEIQVTLEPPEPFGAAVGPCRTAVKDREGVVQYNANTGRGYIQSTEPLKPLEVVIEHPNLRFELQGNEVLVRTKCESVNELDELLSSLHYGLPMILNVEFVDPPIVNRTSGKVGTVSFNWEMMGRQASFDITTQDNQEKWVISAFERLKLFGGGSNRRLLAALHYFHVACRLIAAGNSPWEFMAESVLNLCKVLQILFGHDRDDVRVGLANLGYSKDEIEDSFIPIMVLRNEFDVGHVTIELLKPKQLEMIYKYLENVEVKFRDLLRCILDRVQVGTYKIRQDDDLLPDQEKKSKIEGLINSIGRRGEK